MLGYTFVVELTFENIDPILGGRFSDKKGYREFPSYKGKQFIPANWFKGWLRDNGALYDLPSSIHHHIAVKNCELPDFEPEEIKIGQCTYQMIPPGTRFTTRWRFPLRIGKFTSKKEWIDFIHNIGENPLRGLGANPHILGGRIKLIKTSQNN